MMYYVIPSTFKIPLPSKITCNVHKGRTIRKVMGGMKKKPKKNHDARENAKKKNRAKKKGKKNIHAEQEP